jgi:hypothetical protein
MTESEDENTTDRHVLPPWNQVVQSTFTGTAIERILGGSQ